MILWMIRKKINTPLDLTVEADRQLKQPDVATDDPNSQSEIEDDSHIPTEAYLNAEIEKVKNQVIKDLMVFNEKREWVCWACEVVLGSPHRVRQHVLLVHFQGPLTKCRYCGVFSKTEASLDKHIRHKHKHERDMKRSQWKVAKDEAKAAQSRRSQDPSDCPPLHHRPHASLNPQIRG